MSFLPFQASGIGCIEKMRLNVLFFHALVLENLSQKGRQEKKFMWSKVDKEFWYKLLFNLWSSSHTEDDTYSLTIFSSLLLMAGLDTAGPGSFLPPSLLFLKWVLCAHPHLQSQWFIQLGFPSYQQCISGCVHHSLSRPLIAVTSPTDAAALGTHCCDPPPLSQLWAFQVPCNGACGICKGCCLAKVLRRRPKLQDLSDHWFCWSEPIKGFGWAENKHGALCQACWQLQPLLPVKDTEIWNAI